MIEGPFNVYPASTATEFLDYLRLTNPIWVDVGTGWRHNWLFRGQGQSSLPLIPSIWRTDRYSAVTKMLSLYLKRPNTKADKRFIRKLLPKGEIFSGLKKIDKRLVNNAFQLYCRTQVEIILISSLLDQAAQRGINLPDYTRVQEFVNRHLGSSPAYFVSQITSNEYDKFDKDFREAIHHNSFFALAQHHSIPTRLLDWTTSPYIAAFFAAESALTNKKGEKLAVFAAHENLLSARGIYNFPFPKSDNPFLHAQKGELTIYSGSSHYLLFGDYPTVDYLLEQGSDWNQEIRPLKITLPVDKAGELLRLLSIYEGIARDQLMPTFDNIAHVVKQCFEMDFSN